MEAEEQKTIWRENKSKIHITLKNEARVMETALK
jgi:hypothetical protein